MRSSKIVLEANPDYRGFTWDFAPQDAADQKLVAQMKGKKMPQVGRVEISIIEEDQARWLAFQNGELDIMNMEGPLAPQAHRRTASCGPNWRRRASASIASSTRKSRTPTGTCGTRWSAGFTKEKIALRRAMAMSYNVAEDIKVIRNGQAVEAPYPIPPGVVGHVPDWKSSDQVRSGRRQCAARQVRLQEGCRRLAHAAGRQAAGRARCSSRPDTLGRQQDEMWKKSLDAIGIRMDVHKDKFAELLKLEKQCKMMSRPASWIADYPDGDNFMQLLYGPNTGAEQQRLREDSRIRRAVRQDGEDAAGPGARQAVPGDDAHHRGLRAVAPDDQPLSQPACSSRASLGYKKHPILHAQWQYSTWRREVAGNTAARAESIAPFASKSST